MTVLSEMLDIAVRSAQDARQLYFDPLRRLWPFGSLFRPDGNGLSALGRYVVSTTAVALIGVTTWAQFLSQSDVQRSQERVNELLDALFAQTAAYAMTTPKGPIHEPTARPSRSIRIVEPSSESLVSSRQTVAGTVSDPSSSVWVVVHPLDTSSYWVQPKTEVRSDGSWGGIVYFGRSSSVDTRKAFEVRAIVNPRVQLSEGQVLETWPEAIAVSNATVVRRQ